MAFFDTSGRISVVRFLLALAVALLVLLGCAVSLFYLPAWTNPLIGMVISLALLALICEAARRLHDVGISAWVLVVVAPILAFAALAILSLYWVGIAAWLIGGGAIAASAVLFLRPGERANNRFGAPPPQRLSRAAGPGETPRLRPVLALVLAISAGAGIGYLLYMLDQGMRAQSEWRARMTLEDPGGGYLPRQEYPA